MQSASHGVCGMILSLQTELSDRRPATFSVVPTTSGCDACDLHRYELNFKEVTNISSANPISKRISQVFTGPQAPIDEDHRTVTQTSGAPITCLDLPLASAAWLGGMKNGIGGEAGGRT